MSTDARAFVIDEARVQAAALRVPPFEEALARLLYVVEHRRPCGLVVGPAGTGKSVLLKVLVRELAGSEAAQGACRPLLLDRHATAGSDLGWALAAAMGLAPRDRWPGELLWRAIEDRFQGAAMAGQSIVPVVDHTDQTDQRALVDLGRCCHLAQQYHCTVVVSARPVLSTGLVDAVGPLCDLRIELPLWDLEETSQFVTSVLSAGRKPQLAEDAARAIHSCSGGRMRDILQVLRLVLFAADAQGREHIDAHLVQTVAGEIWQPAARLRSNPAVLPAASMAAAD